jgi:hypothetical protein
MRPLAYRPVVFDDFQFRRYFNPITIGVVHKHEQVVSGTVTARAPLNRNILLRHVIAPIANLIPVLGLVAMMIESILGCLEDREAVVFMAATQK